MVISIILLSYVLAYIFFLFLIGKGYWSFTRTVAPISRGLCLVLMAQFESRHRSWDDVKLSREMCKRFWIWPHIWLAENLLYLYLIGFLLWGVSGDIGRLVSPASKERKGKGSGDRARRNPKETSSRTASSGPFKSWIYSAAKVSQLFRFEYNDMISRNGGRPMFKPLILMVKTLGFHLRSSMIRIIFVYLRRVSSIVKRQGVKGAAIYLKACNIQLMHALAGYCPKKAHSTVRVGLAGSRIPRIIPSVHRVRIRRQDDRIIRLWLSLFSVFRVLTYDGHAKLETIDGDSPFSILSERARNSIVSLLGHWKFMAFFWREFFRLPLANYWDRGSCFEFQTDILEDIRAFPISKSGPFTSNRDVNTSPESLYKAAAYFYSSKGRNLLDALEKFAGRKDNNQRFLLYLLKYSHLEAAQNVQRYFGRPHRFVPVSHSASSTIEILDASTDVSTKLDLKMYAVLGKLGFKAEAAGKVRVFAMVDAWTQWALKPLHDKLFSLLRPIPTDGTFDQMKVVNFVKDLYGKRRMKLYSFDLSAATDRLPVQLQVRILSGLIGPHRAGPWAELLVGRLYYIGMKTFLAMFPHGRQGSKENLLRYKVGQPMGALSSWAMLAVTHHFIVQYVWWSMGHRGVFKDYAVLGDDIVIYNDRVASGYLKVMKMLGVEVNLSKSLVSNHSFEFAKRFIYRGKDVSPLSLKEINGVGSNLLSLSQLGIKWNIDISALLHYIGAGYRLLGSFRTKKIWAATPKLRVVLLYYLRTKVTPYTWFTLATMDRQWVLDKDEQLSLAEEATYLYKELVESSVKKKVKSLEWLIKKYGDNPLIHQVWYPQATEWCKDLDKVIDWFNALGRLPRFESAIAYSGNDINQYLSELRNLLSFVNSCPDFKTTVLRSKDQSELEREKDINFKTFCQEVGIWMYLNSKILGKGHTLSPIKEFIDPPKEFTEDFGRYGVIWIIWDIILNLRSISWVRWFWAGDTDMILYRPPRKTRFIRPKLRKFGTLSRDFFVASMYMSIRSSGFKVISWYILSPYRVKSYFITSMWSIMVDRFKSIPIMLFRLWFGQYNTSDYDFKVFKFYFRSGLDAWIRRFVSLVHVLDLPRPSNNYILYKIYINYIVYRTPLKRLSWKLCKAFIILFIFITTCLILMSPSLASFIGNVTGSEIGAYIYKIQEEIRNLLLHHSKTNGDIVILGLDTESCIDECWLCPSDFLDPTWNYFPDPETLQYPTFNSIESIGYGKALGVGLFLSGLCLLIALGTFYGSQLSPDLAKSLDSLCSHVGTVSLELRYEILAKDMQDLALTVADVIDRTKSFRDVVGDRDAMILDLLSSISNHPDQVLIDEVRLITEFHNFLWAG